MTTILDALTLREATEVFIRYLSAFYNNQILLSILGCFRNKSNKSDFTRVIDLTRLSENDQQLLFSLYERHVNTQDRDALAVIRELEAEIPTYFDTFPQQPENMDQQLTWFCEAALVNNNRYEQQVQIASELRRGAPLIIYLSELNEILLTPAQKKLYKSNRLYDTFHSFFAMKTRLRPDQIQQVETIWRNVEAATQKNDANNAPEIAAFRSFYALLDSLQRSFFDTLPVFEDFSWMFRFEREAQLSAVQMQELNRISFYHEQNALSLVAEPSLDRTQYDIFFSHHLKLTIEQQRVFAHIFREDFRLWVEFLHDFEAGVSADVVEGIAAHVQKYTMGQCSKSSFLKTIIKDDDLALSANKKNWLIQNFKKHFPGKKLYLVNSHSSENLISGTSTSGRTIKRVERFDQEFADDGSSTRKRSSNKRSASNQPVVASNSSAVASTNGRNSPATAFDNMLLDMLADASARVSQQNSTDVSVRVSKQNSAEASEESTVQKAELVNAHLQKKPRTQSKQESIFTNTNPIVHMPLSAIDQAVLAELEKPLMSSAQLSSEVGLFKTPVKREGQKAAKVACVDLTSDDDNIVFLAEDTSASKK